MIWAALEEDATAASRILGEDIPLVFQVSEEGVGGSSVSGETRSRIMAAQEKTASKVLDKVLARMRPRSTREAWAWRQRDKVSSAWVLAILGHLTILNSQEFSLAAAINL